MTGTSPTIQASLAAVMGDVRAVAKSDRNTHQNFAFRGIDAVLNAVGPVLRKHEVVVLPEVVDSSHQIIEMANGKSAYHVLVTVRYTFIGPAGDTLAATVLGEAMDYGDKAVPKAMSVAFRTALLQSFALPTDEPDPDSETYERGASNTTAAPTFATFMKAVHEAPTAEALSVIAAEIQRTTARLTPTQRDNLRRAYSERAATVTPDGDAAGTP